MRLSPTTRAAVSALALALTVPVLAVLPGGGAAGAATAGHDPIGAASATVTGTTATWTGWALDLDAPRSRVVVVALVDGVDKVAVATSAANAAVTRKYRANSSPGFQVAVSVPDDGLRHTTCLAARNLGRGLATVLRCRDVGSGLPPAVPSHDPFGVARYSRSGATIAFTGRATDPDYRNRRLQVALWIDGRRVATTLTRAQGSVSAGTGPSSYYRVAARAAKGRAHTACVRVTDVGYGDTTTLGCKRFDLKSRRGDALTSTETRRMKAVVALARKQFGKPYVWAAEGPKAFDCSGLVMWTYRKNKLSTPRIAQDQYAMAHIVPASRVRPGDLVFYYDAKGYVHHVGIYVSPGMTIAAMSPRLGIGWQPVSQTPGWDGSGISYGSFTHT